MADTKFDNRTVAFSCELLSDQRRIETKFKFSIQMNHVELFRNVTSANSLNWLMGLCLRYLLSVSDDYYLIYFEILWINYWSSHFGSIFHGSYFLTRYILKISGPYRRSRRFMNTRKIAKLSTIYFHHLVLKMNILPKIFISKPNAFNDISIRCLSLWSSSHHLKMT